MTTIEFKKKFKQFPESSYISYYLQQFILLGKSNNLPDYFLNIKDIEDVNDIQELYKIKSQIFLLKSSCTHIIDLINKLNFHLTDEFDDSIIHLKEIGLKVRDKFKCYNEYVHWDLLYIKIGSVISISEFQYAGSNSLFSAKIISLIYDSRNFQNFPFPQKLILILNFSQLEKHFTKI